MKLYLVCIGGYDVCCHLGIYDSLERAKTVCENWIDEEIERLKKWEEECPDFLSDSLDDIKKLKKCKTEREFIMGGGSIELPFVQEFTLNIRKAWDEECDET